MQEVKAGGMSATRKDADELTKWISTGVGIRGVLALLFGVTLLAFPDISLGVLVLTFGAVAFIDGIVLIVTAVRGARGSGRGWMVAQGILSVATGVVVWLWPDLSALALLYVIGAWAIVVGGMQIGASFGLLLSGGDRLFLVLSGLIGIAFGAIMFISPGAGALALLTLIAAFAIVTGITLLVAAFRIRKLHEEIVDRWSQRTAVPAA
jgi:uncharacterized membrane protein HdeD (DUF308 family)